MVEVKRLNEAEIREMGIRNWAIWEKEESRFAHTYDEEEWCYFLEGEVIIETDAGNYPIKPGDFVIFHNGLNCVWDIRQAVRKHYLFK
ncbi:MAG: cupin domain-containing protein [Lentimicrobiaceae bacterium]|nr:cupin domain-containing protein [Lentimicrobiaceae bacterium]MCB9023439.1 cupin domain-containing protein [Lentimicrobiaceae bacterium]MCO5265375.1 cupin domain-containing protein [Lentimicrobium sp.]HPG34492.1 cupin domain-containing protein [Lentimicrobium sp.]